MAASQSVTAAIHWRNARNPGDMASTPALYMVELQPATFLDLRRAPGIYLPAIFGGGGLLRRSTRLRACLERSTGPTVAWGLGLNRRGVGRQDGYPSWMRRFDLIGVRDVGHGFETVPCASCLSPLFDRNWPIEHDVVVYRGAPLEARGRPMRACNSGLTFEGAVRFLASGATVVTSSYHGMYWATLLGRKVLAVPTHRASKFYFFPIDVPLVETADWPPHLARARCFPESLLECRERNRRFAARVCELLDSSCR